MFLIKTNFCIYEKQKFDLKLEFELKLKFWNKKISLKTYLQKVILKTIFSC